MKKNLVFILLAMFLATGCLANKPSAVKSPGPVKTAGEQAKINKNYKGKKVLYIDSYHEGYEWSDGITRGVSDTLKNTGVELRIHRMDTKRNTSDDFKKQAALKTKAEIEIFKPDVVIASDDNAFKYLIMPYYRNAKLPFVFCGLNWDASIYDAPYSNTTGMVEVALIPQLLGHLKNYTDGNRVGYLSAEVLTSRKEGEYYKKLFGIDLNEVYVKSLEEWKKEFINIQKEVDILIVGNNAGINDWDDEGARDYAEKNTKIASGAIYDWMAPFSLLSLAKIPEEQGEWSAEAALKILDGISPSDIPVVTNKKGKIFINLEIAKKLNLVIKPDLLKNAEIVK